MRRSIAAVLIIIFSVVLFTGCWSKVELNELAIAIAMGIDKMENDYNVTVQIINPSELSFQKGGNGGSSITTYASRGKTVFEAIKRLSLKSPRKIYLSHVRVVVFGESLAREGIADTLDFISRNHELRGNVYLLIAKNTKAENILSIQSVLDKIPANRITGALESSANILGSSIAVKLDELINDLSKEGAQAVINGVGYKGDIKVGEDIKNTQTSKPSVLIEIGNIGAFKKDKFIGWLNERESMGYNYIMGNIKKGITTISCGDRGELSVNISNAKSTVKGIIEKDKPKINLDIQLQANISDVECDVDLTKTETIDKLEKVVENEVKREVEEAIKKAKIDFQSDIFEFGDAIYRSKPKQWKNIKKSWNNKFITLPIDINIGVKIKGLETINKALLKDIKE